MTENSLVELPEQIGGLCNLTDLHLSQNELEILPEGIGKSAIWSVIFYSGAWVSYLMDLLSLSLVGAVGTRNYVRAHSHSGCSVVLSMTST